MSDSDCRDCGMPYRHNDGLDLVLSDKQWKEICPEGGVLCPSCICWRAAKLHGSVRVRATIEYDVNKLVGVEPMDEEEAKRLEEQLQVLRCPVTEDVKAMDKSIGKLVREIEEKNRA